MGLNFARKDFKIYGILDVLFLLHKATATKPKATFAKGRVQLKIAVIFTTKTGGRANY